MRANEDEGESEVFMIFWFEGWVVPPVRENHDLVRVSAYVDDDRNHGLMFIYKEKGSPP